MSQAWLSAAQPSTAEHPVIAVVGTMDTKGEEFSFVCDLIKNWECHPLIIDSGVLGEARDILPNVSRESVAKAGGHSLQDVRGMGRGPAIEVMARGVSAIVADLQQRGYISAVFSMGGAEGTVVGCAAMRDLPIGFPKVMVSAIACGRREFGDFTGVSDIMISNSVVDVAGSNSIGEMIYRNAAAAVCGMARAGVLALGKDAKTRRPVVAVTILGNTQQAFDHLRATLEPAYEVIPFHANGIGGATMERLVAEGKVDVVVDLTTNEVSNELRGGVMASQTERRLRVAGPLGVPQVLIPGCVDFFQAGPVDQLRPEWRDRPIYRHNPHFTLVRATIDEMASAGTEFAVRLNETTGPLIIIWPEGGLSLADREGGAFWDPEADQAFLDALLRDLAVPHELVRVSGHINDESTAAAITEAVLSVSHATASNS
jgi:uncharacterized protein (UPF0261 family)